MAQAVPIRAKNTCRLVPSLYPSVGILDRVASPEDLPFILELETWTNDRISTELGILHRIPKEEWVTGRPMASVIMAAFCHPRTGGGRYNRADRGAWYAARDLATAQAEVAYHRTMDLAEIGVFETRVQVRLYLADFNCLLHDTPGIKVFLVKLNPATENARDLQKIIHQDHQVPGLTPNDGSRFLLDWMFVFLEI